MNYEQVRTQRLTSDSPDWDDLSSVEFRGRGKSSNEDVPLSRSDPLRDSESYWPPEAFNESKNETSKAGRWNPDKGRSFSESKSSTPRDRIIPPHQPRQESQTETPTERPVRAERTTFRGETGRENEREKMARQRRKLLSFLAWRGDQTDLTSRRADNEFKNIIISHDAKPLDAATEESVLYDLRDGVLGDADERFLLKNIAIPLQKQGEAAVLNSLADKHEQRFLARFTRTGFKNYRNLSSGAVSEFIGNYPTPLDFQRDAKDFLADIREQNGDAKGAEYEQALDTFMQKMYGKRYEYFQGFERLKQEADKLPDPAETSGEKLSPNTGYAGIARGKVRAIRNAISSQNRNLPEKDRLVALRDATVAEQKDGLKGSEDSILINERKGLYGIFDGAGGLRGGQAASRLASRIVHSLSKRFRLDKGDYLSEALAIAGGGLVRADRNGREIGVTTGVLAKIVDGPDGSKSLAYATAGDSRLYVVHANGKAEQLTSDEGYENRISNYLGTGHGRTFNDAGIMTYDQNTGETRNVTQFSRRNYFLNPGDRIVLCSDGITGDKGSDLMSPEEIGYYVSRSKTAAGPANNLLGYARKADDRSVIVVEAYPKKGLVGGFLDRLGRKNA